MYCRLTIAIRSPTKIHPGLGRGGPLLPTIHAIHILTKQHISVVTIQQFSDIVEPKLESACFTATSTPVPGKPCLRWTTSPPSDHGCRCCRSRLSRSASQSASESKQRSSCHSASRWSVLRNNICPSYRSPSFALTKYAHPSPSLLQPGTLLRRSVAPTDVFRLLR